MKKISLLALTICLIFTACNADENIIVKNNKVENDLVTKNEDSKNLEKLYNEIIELSMSNTECTGNWHFTAIGSKPCGGPEGYIPYSLQINTTDFLAKVNIYNSTKMAFNDKWKITSSCEIAPKPESAKCINGKATLLYESDRDTEKQNLQKMYDEIIALSSSSTSCDGDWNFTAIGSKPCGGPEKYIPYSLQINTVEFLNKVNFYNIAEMEFNEKWNIFSNCDFVTKPKSVVCVNGKATLVYN
jgi:hypothetical protein